MRVALAALLFSEPDLLLLDEPSNHLDLEAALWLESFLKSYRASLIVVSHERDLLNGVPDHILNLNRGGLSLYPGDYDAFVAAMEDVLEVYHRPHDPARPLVCLDETSKQLVAETRRPLPMRSGQEARYPVFADWAVFERVAPIESDR